MTTRTLIGLDFGGTTIKGGAITSDGQRELATGARPFSQAASACDIYASAADLVRDLERRAGEPVESIGAGCAGLFERESGKVLASANMQNLVGTSLTEGLAAELDGRPVYLENDANVAAFGEQWLGAGREYPDLVLVTLGTGVGGGVVMGDRLFTGPGGNAGEIGHCVVHPRPGPAPDGVPTSEYDAPYDATLECGCGSYGCLERLVSATAVERRARDRGLVDDLPKLCERARAEDGPERRLLYAVGRDLGAGLATLVTLLDVNVFAIGGGFGAALDRLHGGASEVLAERRYGTREAVILPAQLGSRAGWIGAARLSNDRGAPNAR